MRSVVEVDVDGSARDHAESEQGRDGRDNRRRD